MTHSQPSRERFDDARPGVPGARVDRYELVEPLGDGGFGVVWHARNVYTGQPVALKLLHATTDDAGTEAARLFREARTAASIGHPGIVQVFDSGTSDAGQVFLAMELIVGRNLGSVLDREGAFAVPRATRIAREVLDALGAAHHAGVVHRDIKPGNILLEDTLGEPRERVRLVDFGISKARPLTGLTMRTRPGTALGTPGYMAPEQYGNAHEADARSDVYGVGATLYAMLSGQKPFGASSYVELLTRVHTSQPVPLAQLAPYLPTGLCAVVDRALARDPAARWQSAAEMARALEAALSPGAIASRPPPEPTARVAEPSRDRSLGPVIVPVPSTPAPWNAPVFAPPMHPQRPRPRWPFIVTAALLVSALVGGGAWWSIEREDPPATPDATVLSPSAKPPETAMPAPPAPRPAPSPVVTAPSVVVPPDPMPVARMQRTAAPTPVAGDSPPAVREGASTVTDLRIVGAFPYASASALGRRAVLDLSDCARPGATTTVHIQLQINMATHMAHPDGNVTGDDPTVARCVAGHFGDQIDANWNSYNAILAYTVRVAAR